MRVDLFDFDLPDDRIALRPSVPRDAARLLVIPAGRETSGLEGNACFEAPLRGAPRHEERRGRHSPPDAEVRAEGEPQSSRAGSADDDHTLLDRRVADLPGLLRPGDALVLNDTRVIPARLRGVRTRGETLARIEVMLHRRVGPETWLAFARPAKRLDIGDRIRFGDDRESSACLLASLDAEVTAKGEDGEVRLRFALQGPALDDAILAHGEMPLPPYIAGKRPADDRDLVDYQTVYGSEPGAVAAPTAGLHMTDELISQLGQRGVSLHRVTLHVGAGTFLPVKADDTAGHRMHPERGRLDAATAAALNAVKAAGGRIVALGTTSLRLLESAADPDGRLQAFSGETDIFITPGYRFRAVDMLLTNFHLPRSTLFMLVAAFAGLARMQAAYAAAVARGYRFYSYGDACLIERGRAG